VNGKPGISFRIGSAAFGFVHEKRKLRLRVRRKG